MGVRVAWQINVAIPALVWQSAGRPSFLYSEGVASHSPGLPRFAATLGGERTSSRSTLKGLCHSSNADDRTPLGYMRPMNNAPRVACFASNPGLCDATPLE